jgi:hypothetical protein
MEKLIYIAENKLPSKKTLLFGIITIIFFFVFVGNFSSQFLSLGVRGIICLSSIVFWILFWICNKYYLPRNKKNKIGVVIAIFSESESERQKLKVDFIFQ